MFKSLHRPTCNHKCRFHNLLGKLSLTKITCSSFFPHVPSTLYTVKIRKFTGVRLIFLRTKTVYFQKRSNPLNTQRAACFYMRSVYFYVLNPIFLRTLKYILLSHVKILLFLFDEPYTVQ